jgi:hypothetical protein
MVVHGAMERHRGDNNAVLRGWRCDSCSIRGEEHGCRLHNYMCGVYGFCRSLTCSVSGCMVVVDLLLVFILRWSSKYLVLERNHKGRREIPIGVVVTKAHYKG